MARHRYKIKQDTELKNTEHSFDVARASGLFLRDTGNNHFHVVNVRAIMTNKYKITEEFAQNVRVPGFSFIKSKRPIFQ